MTKREFLDSLEQGLSGMPKNEIAGRLAFYSEMIDDYMEEGFTEEEAVAKIGSVEQVVSEVIADIPFTKLLKEKFKAKGEIKGWEIVLIVLGFPIWFSLLVGTFAIVVSLYAALWSIVVSLWACFGAFVGAAVGGTLGGILFACTGNPIAGFSIFGGGIVCAGLAIFAFYGCKAVTQGVLWFTKNAAVAIKKCFVKKEKI
ncbi:MAG: DUF1700 domain-containing protein [Clostridia bacterium]|nr:DUF1700 domain-containing protein [Clostridia bacterium]